MLKWRLLILVIYSVLGGIGCPCTLAACGQDGATIEVHRDNWTMEPLTIDIEMDGERITCANLVASDAFHECSDKRVTINFEPLDCSGCTPTNGPRLYIFISATPECINVSIHEKDVLLGKNTFEPTYTTIEPNGPLCSPTCDVWSSIWELPAP